jgi:hypothetical protein
MNITTMNEIYINYMINLNYNSFLLVKNRLRYIICQIEVTRRTAIDSIENHCILVDVLSPASRSNDSCLLAKSISLLISFKASSANFNCTSNCGNSSAATFFDGSAYCLVAIVYYEN